MLNVVLLTLLVAVFIAPSIADEAVAFPGTIYVFQPNLRIAACLLRPCRAASAIAPSPSPA